MADPVALGLFAALVFFIAGGFVWTQHLDCPAEDFILGSSITFVCYMPKRVYPDRCTINFQDIVTFRKDPLDITDTNQCVVSEVSSCSPPSGCGGCVVQNSTHYTLHYRFTVEREDAGTWRCSTKCFDDLFVDQMVATASNCGNRKVLTKCEVAGEACDNDTISNDVLGCDAGTCRLRVGQNCAGALAAHCWTGAECDQTDNTCRYKIGSSCEAKYLQHCPKNSYCGYRPGTSTTICFYANDDDHCKCSRSVAVGVSALLVVVCSLLARVV